MALFINLLTAANVFLFVTKMSQTAVCTWLSESWERIKIAHFCFYTILFSPENYHNPLDHIFHLLLGKSVFKQIYGNFINGIQQWRLLRGGR
jgi:hypothetical protein